MSGEIITIIVSALVAAIATPVGAWVGRKLERARYRIELETLRAEMKEKLAAVKSHELENVRKAADILMESIVPPLQAEISNLHDDIQRFKTILELIWGCPYIERCPVKFELLLPPQGRGKQPNENGGTCDSQYSKRMPERGKARGDPDVGDREPGDNGDGD